MKSVIVPATAILYSALCAAAEHDVLFPEDFELKLPFPQLSPDQLQFDDLSDQCFKELVELSENSALVAAAEKLESCPTQIEASGSTATITADYSACSFTGDYQLACTTAGGKVGSAPSFSVICDITASGEKMKVSAFAYNSPECMGASCEGSLSQNKEFHEEFKRNLEGALATEGITANCDVGNKSPAFTAMLSKFAVFSGMAVLMMNTLS